ncbi:unnamed protein product [Effrenium voratum]|nr:unnamed protein product [Effrenium voratum]
MWLTEQTLNIVRWLPVLWRSLTQRLKQRLIHLQLSPPPAPPLTAAALALARQVPREVSLRVPQLSGGWRHRSVCKSWNRAIIQTRLESLPPNFSTTQLVSISCAYGEDSGASFVARRFKLGPSDQSLAGEAQLVMLRGNSNSMEVEETASSVGCYRCELRSERPVLRLELRYDSGAREEMELPLSHALDGRHFFRPEVPKPIVPVGPGFGNAK